ncbi:MAG: hypothetical protein M1831_005636 [Alyxoria varia]|nr:MAG: hypothetical protein M1831_005636 [Alyxoria varia]
MASVTSLDHDMRQLRMERYTPSASNEVKTWIEETLGERLPGQDLLEGLKDGVALCKLVNMLLPPPGIKYKSSSMPFHQMENISQFLQACEMPPLNLQSHDRFLTVDLYDAKDPAQVLQCLGSFSRAANSINPGKFPKAIGPRKAPTSPTKKTFTPNQTPAATGRPRAVSNSSMGSDSAFTSKSPVTPGRTMTPSLTGGSNSTRTTNGRSHKPTGSVSSWTKKDDQGQTSPAWNIAQYGYMGGASQGNQGINFGAPRQITSTAPAIPNLAEKERRRKEQEAEAARLKEKEEEQRRVRQAEIEAEEERARREEQIRWEEETKKARERERQEVDAQKRKWEEEERKWKEDEEKRQREERAAQSTSAGAGLRDRYRGQHSAEQGLGSLSKSSEQPSENDRIKELERQLEEAKEREMRYQFEREERQRSEQRSGLTKSTVAPDQDDSQVETSDHDVSWASNDRDYLHTQEKEPEEKPLPPPISKGPRPLPKPQFMSAAGPTKPLDPPQAEPQPRPPPRAAASPPAPASTSAYPSTAGPTKSPDPPQAESQSRSTPRATANLPTTASKSSYPSAAGPIKPLDAPQAEPQPRPPPPATATPPTTSSTSPTKSSPFTRPTPPQQSRTDRFLAGNRAPSPTKTTTHFPAEMGMTSESERAAEDSRRADSQKQTKAGAWASKSLLEREMERERERQKEWEEAQMAKGKNMGAGSGRIMGPRAMGGGGSSR